MFKSILPIFFLSCVLVPLVNTFAQNAAVENVLIYEGDNVFAGPCEPSIAIGFHNPDQLVAGSILDNIHYSSDGGKSWQTEKLSSPLGVFGDPCIISDWKGNFYYFHLGDPDQQG